MTDPREIVLSSYDGRRDTVVLDDYLGAGSGGTVHPVRDIPNLLVKLSHRPGPDRVDDRIDFFWAAGPRWAVDRRSELWRMAWPYAKALDPRTGETIGFAMPWLASPLYHQLAQVLRDGPTGRFRDPTWGQTVRTAAGLARTVEAVSARGVVIADLSEENVFVTEGGIAVLADVDGWQLTVPGTGEILPCQGSRPEVTPPEHLDDDVRNPAEREPSSDRWALAVVVATILLGLHPFYGSREDEPTEWEEEHHVRERMCWLFDSSLRVPARTPPARLLPPRLMRLFEACFVAGYDTPARRPTAQQWADSLESVAKDLTSCGRQPLHLFARTAAPCPWCAAESEQAA